MKLASNIVVIRKRWKMKQDELENKYIAFTKIIDLAAEGMFKQDKATAIEFLTDFSCNQGDNLTNEWRDFYGYLFAKYMDGNIKTKVEGQMNPKVVQKPYSEEYRRNIVKSAGDKLEVIGAGH